jgi:hypothetical protein
MSKVWTTPIGTSTLRLAAEKLVKRAQGYDLRMIRLPWIDGDRETRDFIAYWFDIEQRRDLRRLAGALRHMVGEVGDALRLALSRIIITKDHGASLARDVSHSRPHRTFDTNDFPVMEEYLRAVGRLAQRLEDHPPPGRVRVTRGDARKLDNVPAGRCSAVITSPPYLNAIDYMRGHRLSLVWLGHRVSDLRTIRSGSIGAERAPEKDANLTVATELTKGMGKLSGLPQATRRMIDRYVIDLRGMLGEVHRVLRPGGKAVLVVGNSCLNGVFVENATAVTAAAELAGFRTVGRVERELPPSRRYLPPPSERGTSIQQRMRTEAVISFVRPK